MFIPLDLVLKWVAESYLLEGYSCLVGVARTVSSCQTGLELANGLCERRARAAVLELGLSLNVPCCKTFMDFLGLKYSKNFTEFIFSK